MSNEPEHDRDADEQNAVELRAALDGHGEAYRRLIYRAPLLPTTQPVSWRRHARPSIALLAAGLAAVAIVMFWPQDGTITPAPLAGGRSSVPLTLRPDPIRLSVVTTRGGLRIPVRERVTRVRFRPPPRPAQREG